MPAPPLAPEFRRRAIELARQPGASVARVAKDLGSSESGLLDGAGRHRRRPHGGSVDQGARGTGSVRRDNRRLEMEIEILERASSYFARENVLPK
jgi:transposase-like protein